MTPDQSAVSNAFAWVHAVYREAQALLVEAADQLSRRDFKAWAKPEAAGASTTYLLAQVFSEADEYEADHGRDLFIAVSFYPDARVHRGHGPRLLLGTLERVALDGKQATTLINLAARAPGAGDYFRLMSPLSDPQVVCEPTAAGRREFPWIASVESFELPLTSIRTPEDVADVVRAGVALRDDNATLALALLSRWPD